MLLEQKQILTQRLSQNQILSLNILALSSFELDEMISIEEFENPLLDILIQDERYSKSPKDQKQTIDYKAIYQQEDSLEDYLKSQINDSKLSSDFLKIINYLIENLDDKGFLVCTSNEITNILNVKEKDVVECIIILQSLEPVGVGADSFESSLVLQLKKKIFIISKLIIL